jgi:hypothetical protein
MIIQLCGKKRSGKDTVALFLQKHLKESYKIVKFADPLKDALKCLFGFNDTDLEYDKEKNNTYWNISPRNAMQFIGTELFQIEIQKLLPTIGKTFFVKRLLQLHENDNNLIIADTRFKHEIIENSIIIKIINNNINNNDIHTSETELDDFIPHFIIYNNDSLEILENNVIKLLKNLRNL